MADVTLVQSTAQNGVAGPATPGNLNTTIHNLLVFVVAVLGTNPTITTPGGWTQVQKTQGAALSFAMYVLPNNPGGATNPSATLGGTVTGLIAAQFEFSATGANCGLQGSAQVASAIAQLTNVFPTVGQTLYNELFVYAVARTTATITAQNTSNSVLSAWSASVQPQSGIQGMSMDFYWMPGLGQGVNQYPQASGLLSGAVASVAIGAWLNTIASQPSNQDNVYGNSGVLVGGNYQGMLGG